MLSRMALSKQLTACNASPRPRTALSVTWTVKLKVPSSRLYWAVALSQGTGFSAGPRPWLLPAVPAASEMLVRRHKLLHHLELLVLEFS